MTILQTRAESFKQGKALRHKTPREAHAEMKGPLRRSAVAILRKATLIAFPNWCRNVIRG